MKKLNIYKIIGLYEIIGGVLGLFITISLFKTIVIDANNYYIGYLWIFLIAIILYVMSANAGYLLFRKNQRGILLSIIVQILQIPKLVMFGVTYYFVSGLNLGISLGWLETVKFNFNFYLGSTWDFGYGSDEKMLLIGINFIAVIILIKSPYSSGLAPGLQ